MFSNLPQPSGATTKAAARPLAASAFRNAGLLDGDAKMNDQPRQATASTSQGPTLRSLREKAEGRPTRQRIYERPKIAEKDRAGKQLHPNAARIASRGSAGTALSIRGISSVSTPPPRSRARNQEISKVEAAAANAQNKTKGSNVAVLRTFVNSRWNSESRFLNLEKMAEDPIWLEHKLFPPDHDKAPRDIGAVIVKLASQLTPKVETMSLANNGFRDLRQFSTLHHYLPELRNLSFQNNAIRSSKELAQIASRKEGEQSQLRELILLDNHFRNAAVQGGTVDVYRTDVLRRFPNLVMLDLEPVTKIGFDVPEVARAPSSGPDVEAAAEFPVDMGPAVVPPGVDATIAQFLNKFFPCFDGSRADLADVYVPNATFSFAANTSIPPRARIKGYHSSKEMPNQRKLEWSPWLEAGSRNLTRMTTLQKTARTLHSTVEDIMTLFAKLPTTKHDLAQQEKFMVDAWPVSGVLGEPTVFLTIHGQFTELPSMGIRSFDRSFMLAAVAEGSRAKAQGWPCMILSDQLVIRSYSSHEAWAPAPLGVQANTVTPTPNAPKPSALPAGVPPLNPVLAAIPEPRRSLVVQIQQQTGLNVTFAIQCLEGNGWDMQRALANFQELRPSIPAEAFVQ